MRIIADLQIHSKYARAVSKYMELPEIAEWGYKKGINLVGTGDWQHPLWFKEIEEKLEEIRPGVFRIKEKFAKRKEHSTKVAFLLQTEISSIYSQGGRGRRVHNLILSPSLYACRKLINNLEQGGANLSSDGRPIIGLSSKELLQETLETDPRMLFIPAHVWTPWFGLYGSKSGFDSLEEAFGDLQKYIYAVETGLSSDPAMNWQIEELKDRSIVSFSDAHSGAKMGREATVFTFKQISSDGEAEYCYSDIVDAIKQTPSSKLGIEYTIEFFPEEGKYHLSGHRAHNIVYTEKDLERFGEMCPVCSKKLTIGVEHRVCSLASRRISDKEFYIEKDSSGVSFVYDREKVRKPYVSLVPLLEILIEVCKGSKIKASREYERLVQLYPELVILLDLSYEELCQISGERLAEGIRIVRNREVRIQPGYDGVFGKVSIFPT